MNRRYCCVHEAGVEAGEHMQSGGALADESQSLMSPRLCQFHHLQEQGMAEHEGHHEHACDAQAAN